VIPFRDLPVRRKLLLLSLTSTTAALILASIGFLTWDMIRFRNELRDDLAAHAYVLAENSGAALDFNDERVAGEILGVLKLRPAVEMGCLYHVEGAVFSSYRADPARRCPEQPADGSFFGWNALEIVTPVEVNEKRVGTLYIRRSLGDLYDHLRVGAATVLGLLLLATAAAFLMTSRMQRAIASPLLDLSATARTISATRNYSLRAAASHSEDEVGVVVRSFNEMLDRMVEAIERQREANRIKDEFLATLSHELRTPLNAVLGWARMLRSGRLDAATHAKALETIERNAHAQALLIEDLLDMSRIVSGRPGLRVRDADLAAIVGAAVDVVRPAAAAKQLRLSVDLGSGPALTYGDPVRLQQIAWNLLSNAVKFTPPGGRIDVRLARENGYRLSVQDTGAGIDPASQSYVFDRFWQADGTTTREYGGLGLGLAIARQLVELHGGTITAQSAGRGQGSTFEVYLPSVVTAAPREPGRTVVGKEPRAAIRFDEKLLRGMHVLVVDDEDDARALLDATLTQYGAHVTTASNAAEALATIERDPPDVLLSDIAMPEEDGHALIRQLRGRPPSQGGNIPAVAVSAYASVDDGLAAEEAGFQAFVTKPFEPSEVANLVALLGRTSPDRSAGSKASPS
jgi:signal transduction histidine kinase/ActR/RegA family two-component response regulator